MPNKIEVGVVTDITGLKVGLKDATGQVTYFSETVSADFKKMATDSQRSVQEVAQSAMQAAAETRAFAKAKTEERAALRAAKQGADDNVSSLIRLAEAQRATAAASADAGKAMAFNMRDAKAEMALVGDEIGVKIPRHLRGFVAGLPGVGVALNAAFSATAVFFLIQIVVEAGKKVRDYIESLHKLSEEEKKALTEQANEAKEAEAHARELLGIRRQIVLVGKDAAEQARLTAQWAAADAQYDKHKLDALQKQYNLAKKTQEVYESGSTHKETRTVYEMGPGGNPRSRTDEFNIPDVSDEQMKDATTTITLLEDMWGKGLEKLQRNVETLGAKSNLASAQSANAASSAWVKSSKEAEAEASKRYGLSLKFHQEQLKQIDDQAKAEIDAARTAAEIDQGFAEVRRKEQQKTNELGLQNLDAQIEAARLRAQGDEENIKGDPKLNPEQRLSQLKALNQRLLQEEISFMQQKIDIYKLDPTNPGKAAQAEAQLAQIKMKAHNKEIQLDSQEATARIKLQEKSMSAMTNSFQTAINGYIQGTQTIGQAFQRMWTGIVASAASGVSQLGVQFLLAEALHKDSAARQALVDAKSSAVKAFNSAIGGLPFPANVIAAPIAAAAAFSAVMALASFEQGGIMPKSGIALVHQSEGVLTAPTTRMLQHVNQVVNNGGLRKNSLQFTHAPVIKALDARDMGRVLRRNRGQVFKEVSRAMQLQNLGTL